MASDASGVKNTWDMVHMIDIKEINKVLGKANVIAAMDVPQEGPKPYGSCKVGKIQIIDQVPGHTALKGHSGEVFFQLDLTGFLVGGGLRLHGKSVTAPSVRAYAQLQLKFVAADEDPKSHHLVFKKLSEDDKDTFSNNVSIDIRDLKTAGLQKYHTAFKTVAQKMLRAHIKDFKWIFAKVDVFDAASEEGKPWLKPTAVDYSYSRDGNGNAALCVLAMSGGRTPDRNRDIALPIGYLDGHSAAMHISEDLYLRGSVLPTMPFMGVGGSGGDFEYIEQTATARLKPGTTLPLPDDTSDPDVSYPREVQALSAKIVGNALEIHSKIRCLYRVQRVEQQWNLSHSFQSNRTIPKTWIEDVANIFVEQVFVVTPGTKASKDGSTILSFSETQATGYPKQWKEDVPKTNTEVAEDIIMNVGTGLVAMIPGGQIFAVLYFGAELAIKEIDLSLAQRAVKNAKGVSLDAFIASTTVAWTGFKEFHVESAQFQNGLKLVGSAQLV